MFPDPLAIANLKSNELKSFNREFDRLLNKRFDDIFKNRDSYQQSISEFPNKFSAKVKIVN
jgi:hypothetical protein